jgi:ATP-binding cassette, subfamily C (CFTR/MRP), member 4
MSKAEELRDSVDFEENKQAEIPSPEESYSLPSRIFLINYLIYTYQLYKKIIKRGKITIDDVPLLSKNQNFEKDADYVLEKIRIDGTNLTEWKLLKYLLSSVKFRFILLLFTTSAYVIAIFSFSLFIEFFVDDLSASGKNVRTLGGALAIVLTSVCILLQSAVYQSEVLSVRLIFIMSNVLYRSLIQIGEYTAKKISFGDLTNIVTFINLEQRNFQVCLLLTSPISITCLLVLLFRNLGYNAFLAIAMLGIFLYLQHLISKKNSSNIELKDSLADKRISLSQEILEKIRGIKMNVWEMDFYTRITDLRLKECMANFHYFLFQLLLWSFSSAFTYIAGLLCFLGYLYSYGDITTGRIFATIHLLEIMRNFCMFYLGMGLNVCLELKSLFTRMVDIFSKIASNKEMPQSKQFEISSWNDADNHNRKLYSNSLINVRNISVDFSSNDSTNEVLDNCSLNIQIPGIYALVGRVGSGKSTLIKAILGVYPYKGQVEVQGSVGYVQQEPFIIPKTLRENILFGRYFDKVSPK